MRVLPHIKRLDDCFGEFLMRVVWDCGAREISGLAGRFVKRPAPSITNRNYFWCEQATSYCATLVGFFEFCG